MKIIRGKRAVVTGAASGIGRAIALELAEEGADLFLIDIDAEKLAATGRVVRDHGVEAITAMRSFRAGPDQRGGRESPQRLERSQYPRQ
jgi:NAD(P)-dependent dehydrogenase (short-subunit alcohol dehydrogenase family)